MLIQEQRSGMETRLKLLVALEEDYKARYPPLQARHLPHDPCGGTPRVSADKMLTIFV